MQCSSSKSWRLQMISLSSIRCAFSTLHSDWKRAVAFSLCGDIRERRCPWRVPDVDCCLHTAAKWPCLLHFEQVWWYARQLSERWSLLLPWPTWLQWVHVGVSRGVGGVCCLDIPLCCFRNELTGADASDPPLSCCRESFPDSLLSTKCLTSWTDKLQLTL